jgi:hypothetical protein
MIHSPDVASILKSTNFWHEMLVVYALLGEDGDNAEAMGIDIGMRHYPRFRIDSRLEQA